MTLITSIIIKKNIMNGKRTLYLEREESMGNQIAALPCKIACYVKIMFYVYEMAILEIVDEIGTMIKHGIHNMKSNRVSKNCKQREQLIHWEEYADPELYAKCITLGESKTAGAHIYSKIGFYCNMPRTLSNKKVRRIDKKLKKKGINLSELVDGEIRKVLILYEERQKLIKTEDFKSAYAAYCEDWEREIF